MGSRYAVAAPPVVGSLASIRLLAAKLVAALLGGVVVGALGCESSKREAPSSVTHDEQSDSSESSDGANTEPSDSAEMSTDPVPGQTDGGSSSTASPTGSSPTGSSPTGASTPASGSAAPGGTTAQPVPDASLPGPSSSEPLDDDSSIPSTTPPGDAGTPGARPFPAGAALGCWNFVDLQNEPTPGEVGAARCPGFDALIFSLELQEQYRTCIWEPEENEPFELPPNVAEGDCCYAIAYHECR